MGGSHNARKSQGYFVRIRGIAMHVKRGQVARSEDWLAREWHWSRSKVRRVLAELETQHKMIVQQKSNIMSLITIVNYEAYNSNSTADNATDRTTYKTTYKNVEEEIKDLSLFPEPLNPEAAAAPKILPLKKKPLTKCDGEKKALAKKKNLGRNSSHCRRSLA